MAKEKRKGTDNSKVRAHIVGAASEIVGKEEFAAVIAPRLADHVGLRRSIIYYYFDDMDETRKAAEVALRPYMLGRASFDDGYDVNGAGESPGFDTFRGLIGPDVQQCPISRRG
jgi:AcrR family transcriptional regulator